MMSRAPIKLQPDGVVPQTIFSSTRAKTSWVYCSRVSKSESAEAALKRQVDRQTDDQIGSPSSLFTLQAFGQEELK